MITRYILLLGTLIFFYGCRSRQSGKSFEYQQTSISDSIKYASGFRFNRFKNVLIIRVFNPWEGAKGIEYKYILCPRGSKVPDSLRGNPIIYTPVKRVVCLSTTHVAQLSFIGRVNTLVGVAGSNFITDTLARKMINDGKVMDVGFDQALNYEVILSLKPDMVLAYGIHAETANQYKKLEELGINVVLNGEYLETSPLGKLEWVKFLAAFYNVLAETTQKFDKVEEEYLKLSSMYTNLKTKPKVMSGMPWKGVWYVPGGSSYIARMISDAGGYYIWNSIPQRESIPLNFEKVIEHANEADIWINTGQAKTLIDILSEDERLGMIRSFKERQVYNNNARANNTGGNDFWESGLIHPQIILKDLIKIFHPQLLPDYTLVYYKKLK